MTGRSRRFLAPEMLDEAAREVAALARDENVSVALIGGYALQLYGSPRLTGDVDVVADGLIEALPDGESLSFGGVQTESPNGVPIDLVLRDDDYAKLYEDALEEALVRAVELADAPMPVVRLEYLAAMKMGAGRARDEADLEWIILRSGVDLPAARRTIRQYLGTYAAREFDRIVEEARWKSSHGRAE
jgi:hypothetical protein